MIAAMCSLYRVTQNEKYLGVAEQAQTFIDNKLCESDSLFVSWREGQHSGKGFLDDYANEIFALLSLYEATLDKNYLSRAKLLCDKSISLFYDETSSGFFLNVQIISVRLLILIWSWHPCFSWRELIFQINFILNRTKKDRKLKFSVFLYSYSFIFIY